MEPPVSEVRRYLTYDPEQGTLLWTNLAYRAANIGKAAGTANAGGYITIEVSRIGLQSFAHRVAWALMTGSWPEHEIDHRNNDPGDNRWPNLREATPSQNAANKKRRGDNTSGYKGVSYSIEKGKWVARVQCQGRRYFCGLHDTAELAHAAYTAKAKELFGEFANAGS